MIRERYGLTRKQWRKVCKRFSKPMTYFEFFREFGFVADGKKSIDKERGIMDALNLGDFKTRGEVLRRRLDPILDVLVIANIKIKWCVNSNEDIPQTMIDTRDKMYEMVLEIIKTESKPI